MPPIAGFPERRGWYGLNIILRRDKYEATDITDDSKLKAASRQTKAEMAKPGERGYGKEPDGN